MSGGADRADRPGPHVEADRAVVAGVDTALAGDACFQQAVSADRRRDDG